MADYRALKSVSEAVVNLLHISYVPNDFNNDLEFKVFTSKDFTANSITNGVSLFPYRVYVDGARRTPPGRIDEQGRAMQTGLPVDLHFLVTVWAQDASLQNTLAGWVMRTLEDNPILHSTLLNSNNPGVFSHDETVQICLAELRTEDLFRIWDVLGVNIYQLSIPYVARVIDIDSIQPAYVEEGELVQERNLKYFRI